MVNYFTVSAPKFACFDLPPTEQKKRQQQFTVYSWIKETHPSWGTQPLNVGSLGAGPLDLVSLGAGPRGDQEDELEAKLRELREQKKQLEEERRYIRSLPDGMSGRESDKFN